VIVPKPPLRVRDDEARAYIRGLPCLLADEEPCTCGPYINVVTRKVVVEVAHVRSRGAGHGDVENIIPLCSKHHRAELHLQGSKTFEQRHAEALGGRTLQQIAKQLWAECHPLAGPEP